MSQAIPVPEEAIAPNRGQTPAPQLEQIGFLLGRAYYTYIGLLDRVLVESGLAARVKPGMGNVLFALFEEDDVAIGALARRLQLSKSTMTRMVERIRRAKLVETTRDPDDGRSVRVRLTPLGRSLEPRCHAAAERMESLLCSGFSEAEAAVFRRLLPVLTRTMTGELERLEKTNKTPNQQP